jgi:hypothetical protein
MRKRYVYKNANSRPVNIGGYRFEEGQELESDVLINGFNEAVSNGFLELAERKPKTVEQDAARARQTGDTGKVRVVFHKSVDFGSEEILEELEIGPNVQIVFPATDSLEDEIFDGWFKDAGFSKRVNTDKARSPKEGDIHYYGKYSPKPEDPHKTPNTNEPAKDSEEPAPPSIGDESVPGDSETGNFES